MPFQYSSSDADARLARYPKYPKGIEVSKAEFATVQLRPDTFHGEWNYFVALRS